MAILWDARIDGNHYSVRSAGKSIRLYRNGIHHSQYNPDRPLSGCIWDLLCLPAAYRSEKETIRHAGILGFGAGSVALKLLACFQAQEVTGVELDPVHIDLAKRYFGCPDPVTCHQRDAVEWVQAAPDGLFDYLVDDLFTESGPDPVREAPSDVRWYEELSRLLAPGGTLVLNCTEPTRWRDLPILRKSRLYKRFASARCLRIEGYDNRIIALSDQPQEEAQLRQRLSAICQRYPRCRGLRPRYLISSISLSA